MAVIDAPAASSIPRLSGSTVHGGSGAPITTARRASGDRTPTIRLVASAVAWSVILVAIATFVVLGVLPAALVAAGS